MTATEVNEARMKQDIIEETVKRAAKELQEEMDFSILADMFKKNGWVEVEFSPYRSFTEAGEIKGWLEQNCKGHRISRSKRWLFEKESDAVNFILKWNP